jgi:hypothetical protein
MLRLEQFPVVHRSPVSLTVKFDLISCGSQVTGFDDSEMRFTSQSPSSNSPPRLCGEPSESSDQRWTSPPRVLTVPLPLAVAGEHDVGVDAREDSHRWNRWHGQCTGWEHERGFPSRSLEFTKTDHLKRAQQPPWFWMSNYHNHVFATLLVGITSRLPPVMISFFVDSE